MLFFTPCFILKINQIQSGEREKIDTTIYVRMLIKLLGQLRV